MRMPVPEKMGERHGREILAWCENGCGICGLPCVHGKQGPPTCDPASICPRQRASHASRAWCGAKKAGGRLAFSAAVI